MNLNATDEDGDVTDNAAGDDNFISSKTTAKDRNETFIQCWLKDVEKAEKQDGLLAPDELLDDNNEISDSNLQSKESMLDGPQIVVTVDRYNSDEEENASKIANKSTNRINHRFTTVNDEEDSKEKLRELEKNRKKEGESKNKKLIAQLSMKFGQVDRLFEDEEEEEQLPRRQTVVDRHGIKGRLGSFGAEIDEATVKKRLGLVRTQSRYHHYHHSSPTPRNRDFDRSRSRERCRYDGYCKNPDCRYQHTKLSRGRESART